MSSCLTELFNMFFWSQISLPTTRGSPSATSCACSTVCCVFHMTVSMTVKVFISSSFCPNIILIKCSDRVCSSALSAGVSVDRWRRCWRTSHAVLLGDGGSPNTRDPLGESQSWGSPSASRHGRSGTNTHTQIHKYKYTQKQYTLILNKYVISFFSLIIIFTSNVGDSYLLRQNTLEAEEKKKLKKCN